MRDRTEIRARLEAKRREAETELARYVERMAGTAFDLDEALEAASIKHISTE